MRQAMVVSAVLAMLIVAAGCTKTPKAPAGSASNAEGESRTTSPEPSGAASTVGEVKMGMTLDEVTKILGAPTAQVSTDAPGMEMLTCAWEKGDTTTTVQFHNGKVALITRDGGEGTVDAARVKENFSKVKTGMSEAEVENLLGTPTNAGGAAEAGGSYAVRIWQTDDCTYTVAFMNGKVQMTHKENNE